MKIAENFDLTAHNTFGIPARAKLFVSVENETDLKGLLATPEFKNNPKLFLGGGSNVLFTQDWQGIVILNKIKGIEILEETPEEVVVKAKSGEVWHDLVLFAIERGLWGIENLSFIPGTVGAAPMQNIGAYGAELKDVLENVEAYDIETGEKRIFVRDECKFGYRDSIFKNEQKGKYFIYAITLRLKKNGLPNTNYRVLQEYLKANNITEQSLKNISDAVVAIRKSKLPDPKIIGNAGSFFKNVFVTPEKYIALLREFPDLPSFEEEGEIKIPAGWLIEMCGWKGKRIGNVGVHERQALVLVNHGGGTGEEIKALALEIIRSVEEKFGITLAPEVNFV